MSEWKPTVYKILLEVACDSVDTDGFLRQRCLQLVEDIWVGDPLEKAGELVRLPVAELVAYIYVEDTITAVKSIVVTNSGKIMDESQSEAQEGWLNLLGCLANHGNCRLIPAIRQLHLLYDSLVSGDHAGVPQYIG